MSFILTKWYVNLKIKGLESICIECFILTKWYVNTTGTSTGGSIGGGLY
ncbi:hypothetical protein QK1_1499 [Clostridioides difficile DA00142]|nr:hypothetical protein QK1_1499 [Clostridioides difficile DA00142]